MGLTLTVLGCSGSYPGPGRACSGYLVDDGTTRLALDLGTGSLARLQQHLDPQDLDAVVLTHEHPDHWVDLAGLRVLLRYGTEREGVRVIGTEGTRRKAESLTGGLAPTFAWETAVDGDEVTVGGLSLRFAATEHWVPTLAVRVDGGGRSLAYSADTGPGWSLTSLGSPVDLAVVEATVLRDGEGSDVLHLSARQAGALAAAAGARRLLLTHLWPTVDPDASSAEAAGTYDGEVSVASDGLVVEV